MTYVDYFKLQAKNLFKDYKTKKPIFDEIIKDYLYEYAPKYFDIDQLICDYDLNEDDFSLMKAQHVIALMIGFDKWSDLLKASEAELELRKLLFLNQDIICWDSWQDYIGEAEDMNGITFNAEEKIGLFEALFLSGKVPGDTFPDYLLKKHAS